MQAIILAAGMGKRLKELTQNNTKCMVKVNGVTLIERMLRQLDDLNLKQIVMVVGYEGAKLIDFIGSLNIKTGIRFVENNVYDKTNNIYSLYLAKDYLLADDTLLLESDLIFESGVLESLIADKRDTLALVDKYESWMDGTCIRIGQDDTIESFIPASKFKFEEISCYYKTVNIYKFGKHFSETHYVPFLEAYSHALGNNEYYEQVLRVITMLDDPGIKAKRLNGELWYEIDDIQDLDIASSMFADGDGKIDFIQSRYGGYWRYPKLIDFCYLVNPYFPPQKLVDEIKASFERLITQYPSGMKVNSLLAAKNFGVKQDYIAVGNGAAELIKSIMSGFKGKLGVIRPTFEEYPNRYQKEDCEVFVPKTDGYRYDAQSIIDYFDKKGINQLIIINPDNPTGNYIDRNGIMRLLDWSVQKNIRLVIDESFVDFADEIGNTLIDNAILEKYENIIVVKSISKSYGVPGLRLGVICSSDKKLIDEVKKDVSIWNINSFAEFYMQIVEKYHKDYTVALIKIRQTRGEFVKKLKAVPNIKVYPSQANYLMLELTNITARDLTKRLLLKYNLLIKDLTGKIADGRQYVRIAIRTEEDNDKLCSALKEIIRK